MEEKVFLAALAGLLHDVGKLEQRARADPWNPAAGIEPEGQPIHATYSGYFIQHHVPAAYHAALHGMYHHQPQKSPAADKRLSMLVSLADKLSAGERADVDQDEKQKYPQQLVSIFDRLFRSRDARNHYLPLKELSLDRDTLFSTVTTEGTNTVKAYEHLRDGLRQAAGQDAGDPEAYLENLLAAMQRYTWCVPSAYYHSLPDVSLYDHSRMTAALAVCLTDASDAKLEQWLAVIRRAFEQKPDAGDVPVLAEPAAVLIGGDISGIQDFIYTITAHHAAKTLRGRSFYLQLLTEALLRMVLRELGLPYTNVIYAGGGHFYLLAPPSAIEQLPAIREKITASLLQAHGTGLYLALAGVKVPLSGFRLGQFPTYWDAMHAELSQAKQMRYTELNDGLYDAIFKPVQHGGNQERVCEVCGAESEEVKKDTPCPMCTSFDTEIGRDLPHANFVALGLGQPRPAKLNTALGVLASLGMQVKFVKDAKAGVGAFESQPQRVILWALDDPERGQWPVCNLPAVRWLHYTVNQVPELDFNDLQEKAHGIPRLGVLRMDVDNLGNAFKHGFGEGKESIASLARISALSMQISLFFEGWVKRICEDKARLVYTVYAGGDDVFLISPWDETPLLAKRIAAEFAEYVHQLPELHISGGMAFIHGKYPVYQAAADAGESLQQAKGREGKNAFHFLGETWAWSEFDQLHRNFEHLLKMVQPEKEGGLAAPQAVLQLLQQLRVHQKKVIKVRGKNKVVFGPYMWMGDYHFTRRKELAKPELKEMLEKIHQDLKTGQGLYGSLPLWSTAARWAQLFVREKKTKKNQED